MSINVGFLNSYYNLTKFGSIDNRLVINSYNNSNTILLNNDDTSHSNAVINYKNKYSSGLKSGLYSIDDITSNYNILSLSSNNIVLNPFVKINNNINIANLLITSNNITNINSNLFVNLYKSADRFNVNYLNKNIIDISSSNINLSISNTLFNINNNGVNIYSDIHTSNTSVLYINTIKSNTPNGIIRIYNPYLIGLQIQSSIIYNNVSILNDANTYNNPSFIIERFYNNYNILQISTCNIEPTPSLVRNFTIDNNGFVGIGTAQPTAPLSISHVNPVIFEYNGINYGDKFNISKNAYVGIGTTNSTSLLSINRADDLTELDIRKNPLLNMNIEYQVSSNYTTSNYKQTTFKVFDYSSNISYSNYILNTTYNCNLSFTSNNIIIDLLSDVNIIPFQQNNVIRSNINVVNNFYLYDADMYNSIINSSNVIVNNTINFLTIPNTIQVDSFNNYQIRNKIYYPYSLNGTENVNEYSYNYDSNIINNFITYSYNYGYILTKYANSNNLYTSSSNISSNFYRINYNRTFPTLNSLTYINYNINLYVEKNNYVIDYIDIRPVLQKSPHFLYATSNNNFCASLSSYSTLSLGKQAPDDGKYLLYAPAASLLSSIQTDTVKSITNSNINFSYCNLINIDDIISYSNNSKLLTTDNAIINNLNVNNISLKMQTADNITTTNINFATLKSSYLSSVYSNVNINTLVSIGKSEYASSNNNEQLKITINNSINTSNKFFKYNNAVKITNEINTSNRITNPALTIYGYNNSMPYLNISTASSEYFMRITCNLYQYSTNEWSESYQLCCDTITGTSRESYYNLTQPHIFQHIKKYNLITIGENNNICIDVLDRASISSINQPFTNATNKISLGLPIGIIDSNAAIYSDWPQYFTNNIVNANNGNNQYMLNVYGNINISSIHGKPIIKGIVDNGSIKNSSLEKTSVAIGGEPDANTTLYVYGNGFYNSNLSTSNNLYVLNNAFVNNDLTVNGRIFTSDGVTTVSDARIKKDIRVINNSLDKLCSISGYTYTRIDTGNKESGLIAQEVNGILPEVIYNTNTLMTISYGNMTGIIIEAIKELKNKIDDLEKVVYKMDILP
jgi:hypothetical protein